MVANGVGNWHGCSTNGGATMASILAGLGLAPLWSCCGHTRCLEGSHLPHHPSVSGLPMTGSCPDAQFQTGLGAAERAPLLSPQFVFTGENRQPKPQTRFSAIVLASSLYQPAGNRKATAAETRSWYPWGMTSLRASLLAISDQFRVLLSNTQARENGSTGQLSFPQVSAGQHGLSGLYQVPGWGLKTRTDPAIPFRPCSNRLADEPLAEGQHAANQSVGLQLGEWICINRAKKTDSFPES